MVEVIILKSLFEEIENKFKRDADKVYNLIESIKENPNKGKFIGRVGGFLIKELKYKGFRFYFIVEGNRLKLYLEKEIVELLLKFVRMSDKKRQQKTINEIKEILIKIGPEGL